MTSILAKVGAVHKEGDKYLVIIRIILGKYRGSFNTLAFGEIKPFIGSYHNGRLDLVYYADPGLKTGHPFPLWKIDRPEKSARTEPRPNSREHLRQVGRGSSEPR